MKITADRKDVEIQGIDESQARGFSIKADGHAFKILSSTLYTHKIRAVIREVVCNAWDAQQEAKKKDVPIQVHLPTRFEPWFEVTDFGTGLDNDRVLSLYSTYFESTKSRSNNAIGGFGIGSKSPFAYVDSFTVEARHNGKHRIYSAFIGASGAPSIIMLAETDLEKGTPNGMTVKMDVKNEDINTFIDEAKRVLKEFANPSVQSNVAIPVPLPVFTNKQGRIYEAGTYESYLNIRMGNVIYPVPPTVMSKLITFDNKPLTVQNVFNMSGRIYVVDFPIGKLEVAPSREQLSMTKETEKNLIDGLTSFAMDFYNERKEAFRKAIRIHQYFEVAKKYKQMLNIPNPNFAFWLKSGGIDLSRHSDYIGYVRSNLNQLSNSADFAQFIDKVVSPTQKIESKKKTRRFNKYQKIIDNKLYWKRPSINQSFLAYTPSGTAPAPDKDIPIIVLLTKTTQGFDSENRYWITFNRRMAAKGRTVFAVRLPVKDDESFKRILLRYIGNVPNQHVMTFEQALDSAKDVTDAELKQYGIDVAAAPVVKVKGAKEFTYGYISTGYNDLSFDTGSTYYRNVTSDPTSVEKDLTTIYYANAEEWRQYRLDLVNRGGNYVYVLQNVLIPEFQKWQNASNSPHKEKAMWFCKSHIEMIKDDKRFVPIQTLLKKLGQKMVDEMKYPCGAALPSYMVTSSYNPHISYFGAAGSGTDLEAPNGWFAKIPNTNKLKQHILMVRGINNFLQYHTLKNADNHKNFFDYAKDFGIDYTQKHLDTQKKTWDNDIKQLEATLNKYEVLKNPDWRVSEFNFKHVAKHMKALDLLTPKQLKELNS